jgi:hypothetical protein
VRRLPAGKTTAGWLPHQAADPVGRSPDPATRAPDPSPELAGVHHSRRFSSQGEGRGGRRRQGGKGRCCQGAFLSSSWRAAAAAGHSGGHGRGRGRGGAGRRRGHGRRRGQPRLAGLRGPPRSSASASSPPPAPASSARCSRAAPRSPGCGRSPPPRRRSLGWGRSPPPRRCSRWLRREGMSSAPRRLGGEAAAGRDAGAPD